MYGLPENIDLSFFVGRELNGLTVGIANVQFNFDGPVLSPGVQSLLSLSVQSLIEHSSNGVVNGWDRDENNPLSAATLLSLVGKLVTAVQGDIDGTLSLRFSNGDVLTVFDSEGYDAYQICYEDQRIYV
ncbi:MAG: DUF6188 family protein [Nitrospirota bacterium]